MARKIRSWENKMKRSLASSRKVNKRTELLIAELVEENRKHAEENKKHAEESRKQAEEFWKQAEEFWNQAAERAIQSAKTDKKIDRIAEQLGGVANGNGYASEYFFYIALDENPVLGNIRFDEVKRNLHVKTKRLEGEFDIVMYNGDSIALIEAKYNAHLKDAENLVNKKIKLFRELNPDYKDYKIYLGLASFSFYEDIEKFARENGIALLKQIGEVLEIEADFLKTY